MNALVFVVVRAAPSGAAPDACRPLLRACREAGFSREGRSGGKGLVQDCVTPLLAGRTGAGLPGVERADVDACNASMGELPDVPVAEAIPLTEPKLGPGEHPNVVFVLADDFSSDLLRFMPHVLDMQKNGAAFTNFFVTDSLCCPSRSSIFTGRFPHNTGVYTNQGRDGGFATFMAKGNDRVSFAVALRNAAYAAGMMGKFLNGYEPAKDAPGVGWSEWDVIGNGYGGFDYDINRQGKAFRRGSAARDYATDVLKGLGVDFIQANAGRPFFLEEATFAPHSPYTPAPRDAKAFPGLAAPRGPAYGAAPDAAAPNFLKGLPALTDEEMAEIDGHYRLRAQSVLAIDAMIGDLQAALKAAGLEKKTYFVFASDNGYHMGEHRMHEGKMTAYDTDIRVPLVVTGPGIAPGTTVSEVAENIDLCPTFAELAGAQVPRTADGRSLVPLLLGKKAGTWRTAALIEHRGGVMARTDPDSPVGPMVVAPTYEALRTRDKLYVEYVDGEREFHDLKADPAELKNTYAELSSVQKSALAAALSALKGCHGAAACSAADHPALW